MGESARHRIDKHFMFFSCLPDVLFYQLGIFQKWGGDQRLFGTFPRIHPLWWGEASLTGQTSPNGLSDVLINCGADTNLLRSPYLCKCVVGGPCLNMQVSVDTTVFFSWSCSYAWYWSVMTWKDPDNFCDAGIAKWKMTPFVRNLNVFEHNNIIKIS